MNATMDEDGFEDPALHETMTGTLFVLGLLAHVLFDTGASHSFMFEKFKKILTWRVLMEKP